MLSDEVSPTIRLFYIFTEIEFQIQRIILAKGNANLNIIIMH